MTETHRYLIALLCILFYAIWVAVLFHKHKKKHKSTHSEISRESTLVVYASQSGTAEKIAQAKASQLEGSSGALVVSMASLSLSSLRSVSKAIFVVSTYGEGEPPDMGRKFNRALQQATRSNRKLLSHLQFEVVGLGDRQYSAFCQFAITLFKGIEQLGGNAAKPLLKLDAGRGEHLAFLNTTNNDEHDAAAVPMVLSSRTLLNGKGQADEKQKLFALSFTAPTSQISEGKRHAPNVSMHWKAGDILDVLVDEDGDTSTGVVASSKSTVRSYTIASVPEEGDVKLVVRQLVKDDGSLGAGSGYLTESLQPQQQALGVIRTHANANINNLHAPLLLIAAGSGVAGIRAQLAKRALLENAGPVWILFGERCPDTDNILDSTLSPFHQSSCISHKHIIYSQSPHEKGYVQHLLLQHSHGIRSFLGSEGLVYVCGRYDTMGKGVDKALCTILGDVQYQKLNEEHRYYRDLY